MSALQINPNDQYVIVGIGHLFFACQRYTDAIKWWEKLVDVQPDNIKILTEIGNSYRKIKDFDKAIEYYDRALGLDKQNFFALYGLAESYRGKKDFKKAIFYWESILKFDPHNKLIINRYADSLRGLGEYEKALECFNQILHGNDDYYALLGKASTLSLMGEYQKSQEIYLSLRKKDPLNPRPVLELAELWQTNTGEKDKAIRLLQEFLKENPSNTEISEKLDQYLDETQA
jgi:tetratricopeptide (TPR) repeat protein